jgi:hypothetical protein
MRCICFMKINIHFIGLSKNYEVQKERKKVRGSASLKFKNFESKIKSDKER